MTLTNPSLVLSFVGSQTIPDTTVSNSEIVRQSIEIDWQMMSNLKSTSDKAKISITKESVAVSRIMSFDGDIKAVLKDGDTVLFTGFLSNKYKWSVTNHGEQVLSLTIEDNTRLLETIYSDKDQLINKEFYIPARVGHPVASGVLVDIATICGISLDASVPEIDVDIIKTVSADTECVDIIDQVCFELGYCYKFKADGKLYLWQIAKGDEPVSATLTKDSLYAVQENAVIVNKSLKQYNRAIVKYTDISTRNNALIYQDISGQDGTHPYCYIQVNPGYAYPSGLDIATHTDEQLKAFCDVSDLDEGKTIVGIGDSILTEFECTNSAVACSIQKHSATQISVLIKNTTATPIFILKLQAKASITYEEGESKVYAGSVSDKKYYETSLEYIHDNDTASKLGNLIYQFYKHSNLAYTFYSKTQLALGDIIMLQENQYSGVNAKLMINAIVDSSATGVYQYVGYSFTPFNLQEDTSTDSKGYAPAIIPPVKTIIQYALSSSPTSPPGNNNLGSDTDEELGSNTDKVFAASSGEWTYTVPNPVPDGKYVWRRESTDNGVTWAYSRLTGEKGEDGGLYGYELFVASATFYQDRSRSDNQYISVYTIITGYENVTSTISCDTAPNVITIQSGSLVIPYYNTYSEVVIRAVLIDNATSTIIETRSVTLKPIDVTPMPEFLGCVAGSSAPPTPSGRNLVPGDYFCVSSTSGNYTIGSCWRYTSSGWIELNISNGTPTEMLDCLNGFRGANVDLNTISDSNAISWFRGIVASKIIAGEIWGQIANFDKLTINNKAEFFGTLSGDYLKTTDTISTQSTYNSQSDQTSGVAKFYWSDIQSVYETYYNSSYYGNLLSASGTINGKTASKVVYHTASSIANKVDSIASSNFSSSLAQTVNVCTAICTTKYRITVRLNSVSYYGRSISYKIVRANGTTEQYQIVYGDSAPATTIVTKELYVGDSLKLYAIMPNGEPYVVEQHHVDNYGVGTNVITSDGWKYNVNGSLPLDLYCASIVGTGTTKPTLTVEGTSWSANSVGTVKVFAGQTGSSPRASTTGSAALPNPNPQGITSIGTATLRFRGGSNTQYSIVSASWGSSSITFNTPTQTITINESTADLEYWYINFIVYTNAGGVVSKGLQPWEDSQYSIGSSGNRWLNGYYDNLYSSNIESDEIASPVITASTNILGQLGNANSRNNAYVSTLDCTALTGINYFNPLSNFHGSVKSVTSSSTSLSSQSLGTADVEVDLILISPGISSFTFKFNAPSGTISYLYLETSSYASDFSQGSRAYSGSVASTGDAVSFSGTRSSAGAVGLMISRRSA